MNLSLHKITTINSQGEKTGGSLCFSIEASRPFQRALSLPYCKFFKKQPSYRFSNHSLNTFGEKESTFLSRGQVVHSPIRTLTIAWRQIYGSKLQFICQPWNIFLQSSWFLHWFTISFLFPAASKCIATVFPSKNFLFLLFFRHLL